MKATIKGVEMDLDGKMIVLPIEDARKLMEELEGLFGDHIPSQPVVMPIIVERVPWYSWPWQPGVYPVITCEDKGTGSPQIQQPFTVCSAIGN